MIADLVTAADLTGLATAVVGILSTMLGISVAFVAFYKIKGGMGTKK